MTFLFLREHHFECIRFLNEAFNKTYVEFACLFFEVFNLMNNYFLNFFSCKVDHQSRDYIGTPDDIMRTNIRDFVLLVRVIYILNIVLKESALEIF